MANQSRIINGGEDDLQIISNENPQMIISTTDDKYTIKK